MKYYKVIAQNFEDLTVQVSDQHTWEECETLYLEYMSYDEVGSVSIICIGST